MTAHSIMFILLGIAITVVCLLLSISQIDIHLIYPLLYDSHISFAFPLLFFYSIYYWLKAVRWKQLLEPIAQTNAANIFSPMMLGFFGNNILPMRLGEFIRMYLVAKKFNITNSQVLATIILERILDVLSVVFFLGITFLIERNTPATLLSYGIAATIICFCLLITMAIYIHYPLESLKVTKHFLFFLPDKIKNKLLHHIEVGTQGWHAIRDKKLALKIIVASLAQWACVGISIYFSLLAVGITAPFSASILALSFTVFAVMIPAAPGFFGTIQLAFLLALRPFNISGTNAFAASVFFHVLTYFFVVFLGIIILHRLGYTLKKLKSDAIQSQDKE